MTKELIREVNIWIHENIKSECDCAISILHFQHYLKGSLSFQAVESFKRIWIFLKTLEPVYTRLMSHNFMLLVISALCPERLWKEILHWSKEEQRSKGTLGEQKLSAQWVVVPSLCMKAFAKIVKCGLNEGALDSHCFHPSFIRLSNWWFLLHYIECYFKL